MAKSNQLESQKVLLVSPKNIDGLHMEPKASTVSFNVPKRTDKNVIIVGNYNDIKDAKKTIVDSIKSGIRGWHGSS